jgi:Plavaka transposase
MDETTTAGEKRKGSVACGYCDRKDFKTPNSVKIHHANCMHKKMAEANNTHAGKFSAAVFPNFMVETVHAGDDVPENPSVLENEDTEDHEARSINSDEEDANVPEPVDPPNAVSSTVGAVKTPDLFDTKDWQHMWVMFTLNACGGRGLSLADIDDFFAMMRYPGFSLENLEQLNTSVKYRRYLDNLVPKNQIWTEHSVTVKCVVHGNTYTDTFLVVSKNLVEHIKYMVGKFSGPGNGWEWCYKETLLANGVRYVDLPTSGEFFKEMTRLFPGLCILGWQKYSDKASLNAIGSDTGYPGIGTFVNGHMDCLRKQYDDGCFVQLPVLVRPKHVPKDDWPAVKAAYISQIFQHLHEPLLAWMEASNGVLQIRDSYGYERPCVIALHSHVGDWEELNLLSGLEHNVCFICPTPKNVLVGYPFNIAPDAKKSTARKCTKVFFEHVPSDKIQPGEYRGMNDLSSLVEKKDWNKLHDLGVRRSDQPIPPYLRFWASIHTDMMKSDSVLNIYRVFHEDILHGIWLGLFKNYVVAISNLVNAFCYELKEYAKEDHSLKSFVAANLTEEIIINDISTALFNIYNMARFDDWRVPCPLSFITEVSKGSDAHGRTGRKFNGREFRDASNVLWSAMVGLSNRLLNKFSNVDQLIKEMVLKLESNLVLLFSEFNTLIFFVYRTNHPQGHTLATLDEAKVRIKKFYTFLETLPDTANKSNFCTPKAHLFSHFEAWWISGMSAMTSADLGEGAQTISTKGPYLKTNKRGDIAFEIARHFQYGFAVEQDRVLRNLPKDCQTRNAYDTVMNHAVLTKISCIDNIRDMEKFDAISLGVLDVEIRNKFLKTFGFLSATPLGYVENDLRSALSNFLRVDFCSIRPKDICIKASKHGVIFGAYLAHVSSEVIMRPNQRIHAISSYYNACRFDLIVFHKPTFDKDLYGRLILLFKLYRPGKKLRSLAFVQIYDDAKRKNVPTSLPKRVKLLEYTSRFEVINIKCIVRKEHALPLQDETLPLDERGLVLKNSAPFLVSEMLFQCKRWKINPWKSSLEPRYFKDEEV